jgi:hypothetical protein
MIASQRKKLEKWISLILIFVFIFTDLPFLHADEPSTILNEQGQYSPVINPNATPENVPVVPPPSGSIQELNNPLTPVATGFAPPSVSFNASASTTPEGKKNLNVSVIDNAATVSLNSRSYTGQFDPNTGTIQITIPNPNVNHQLVETWTLSFNENQILKTFEVKYQSRSNSQPSFVSTTQYVFREDGLLVSLTSDSQNANLFSTSKSHSESVYTYVFINGKTLNDSTVSQSESESTYNNQTHTYAASSASYQSYDAEGNLIGALYAGKNTQNSGVFASDGTFSSGTHYYASYYLSSNENRTRTYVYVTGGEELETLVASIHQFSDWPLVDQSAFMKSVTYFDNAELTQRAYDIQYVKKEGNFVPRFVSFNQNPSFIVVGDADVLSDEHDDIPFINNQLVNINGQSYYATYGLDYKSGWNYFGVVEQGTTEYGLILRPVNLNPSKDLQNSANLVIDFPNTRTLELDSITYKIEMDETGKMQVSFVEPPSTEIEFPVTGRVERGSDGPNLIQRKFYLFRLSNGQTLYLDGVNELGEILEGYVGKELTIQTATYFDLEGERFYVPDFVLYKIKEQKVSRARQKVEEYRTLIANLAPLFEQQTAAHHQTVQELRVSAAQKKARAEELVDVLRSAENLNLPEDIKTLAENFLGKEFEPYLNQFNQLLEQYIAGLAFQLQMTEARIDEARNNLSSYETYLNKLLAAETVDSLLAIPEPQQVIIPIPDMFLPPNPILQLTSLIERAEEIKVLINENLEPPTDIEAARANLIASIDVQIGLTQEISDDVQLQLGEVEFVIQEILLSFLDDIDRASNDINMIVNAIESAQGDTRENVQQVTRLFLEALEEFIGEYSSRIEIAVGEFWDHAVVPFFDYLDILFEYLNQLNQFKVEAEQASSLEEIAEITQRLSSSTIPPAPPLPGVPEQGNDELLGLKNEIMNWLARAEAVKSAVDLAADANASLTEFESLLNEAQAQLAENVDALTSDVEGLEAQLNGLVSDIEDALENPNLSEGLRTEAQAFLDEVNAYNVDQNLQAYIEILTLIALGTLNAQVALYSQWNENLAEYIRENISGLVDGALPILGPLATPQYARMKSPSVRLAELIQHAEEILVGLRGPRTQQPLKLVVLENSNYNPYPSNVMDAPYFQRIILSHSGMPQEGVLVLHRNDGGYPKILEGQKAEDLEQCSDLINYFCVNIVANEEVTDSKNVIRLFSEDANSTVHLRIGEEITGYLVIDLPVGGLAAHIFSRFNLPPDFKRAEKSARDLAILEEYFRREQSKSVAKADLTNFISEDRIQLVVNREVTPISPRPDKDGVKVAAMYHIGFNDLAIVEGPISVHREAHYLYEVTVYENGEITFKRLFDFGFQSVRALIANREGVNEEKITILKETPLACTGGIPGNCLSQVFYSSAVENNSQGKLYHSIRVSQNMAVNHYTPAGDPMQVDLELAFQGAVYEFLKTDVPNLVFDQISLTRLQLSGGISIPEVQKFDIRVSIRPCTNSCTFELHGFKTMYGDGTDHLYRVEYVTFTGGSSGPDIAFSGLAEGTGNDNGSSLSASVVFDDGNLPPDNQNLPGPVEVVGLADSELEDNEIVSAGAQISNATDLSADLDAGVNSDAISDPVQASMNVDQVVTPLNADTVLPNNDFIQATSIAPSTQRNSMNDSYFGGGSTGGSTGSLRRRSSRSTNGYFGQLRRLLRRAPQD